MPDNHPRREEVGAVVPAAQTRFYLARMLAHKGEVERTREMFADLQSNFQGWSMPAWQEKCEKELEAVPPSE